jgi:hypothetical protein
MRYDLFADALQPYGEHDVRARLIRAEHLVFARFETSMSHRYDGLIDLVFSDGAAYAIVPWISIDGLMLLEREFSPFTWPRWMTWLDDDQCDAIEARIEPWMRARVLARLENGSGERFFTDSNEIRGRIERAKGAGWLGAVDSRTVLEAIAPHRYAWRFARNAHVLIRGRGAIAGAALLARRASLVHAVAADAREAADARAWFGLDCFSADPVPERAWDLYVGPRQGAPAAAAAVFLDGEAVGASEVRVPIAQPLPPEIMISFDVDDAPEVRAISVAAPPREARRSALVAARIMGGSSGRVALVVREDCLRAADADTDAVIRLKQLLEQEGFAASIVVPSHLQSRDHDLIHVFGHRYAHAVIDELRSASQRGIPIVVTPYADDPRDEAHAQTHSLMAGLGATFDENQRADYLNALALRRLLATDLPADEPEAPVRELFALARVCFVTCGAEETHVRQRYSFAGTVIPLPALASPLDGAADVAALVGTDDFVLAFGPVEARANQYLLARAAAAAGLPLVVCGTVVDAGYYRQMVQALGDDGMWLPPRQLTAEQQRGLLARARVAADVSWSGRGLHRLATAAAGRAALVTSSNGFGSAVWGAATVAADPASVDSIAAALRSVWDRAEALGTELAARTATVCDPFACVVSTVSGYQRALSPLVSP